MNERSSLYEPVTETNAGEIAVAQSLRGHNHGIFAGVGVETFDGNGGETAKRERI
jgi:hypothetical protein